MPAELVKTVTRDGLRLDGVWQAPEGDFRARPRRGGMVSALLLHGAGSNFYAGGLFEQLAPVLLKHGCHVVRVNTRGHDGYYAGRAAGGVTRFGAAYERVADCTLDLAGWLHWLQRNDLLPTVLIGHSLGAIKAVYAEAHQPSEGVAGVIAISPPRLSCSAFQWGTQAGTFGNLLREAHRLAGSGGGQQVLESTFPFPMLITADAFLDKYGGETYNVVQLAPQVRQPLTFIYGDVELREGGVAFAGVPEALREARRQGQRLGIEIVEGADHFYVGRYDALANQVVSALSAADIVSGESAARFGGSPRGG